MRKMLFPMLLCVLAMVPLVRTEATADEPPKVNDQSAVALAGEDRLSQVVGEDVASSPNPVCAKPSTTSRRPVDRSSGSVVVKAQHAPCTDIVKAIHTFLERKREVMRKMASRTTPTNAKELKVLAEPESNSVIVIGSEEEVHGVTELIRKLDAAPDLVLLEIVIAEKGADEPVDERELDRYPDALATWAKTHGRLQVLSRPQVMTENNTSASVQVSTREGQSQDALKLDLTPRIITGRKGIVVELVVGKSKTTNGKGGHWTKEEISSGSKIVADDGKTVVVTGLRTSRDDNEPKLVIALTPHIVSEKPGADGLQRPGANPGADRPRSQNREQTVYGDREPGSSRDFSADRAEGPFGGP